MQKKIMFKILVHLLVKLIDTKSIIADDLVIRCAEIIDKVAQLYNETSEAMSINSNHKKATCKTV